MDEVTAEMIERGRGSDGDASQQRRRTASRMREAREKLTSSGTGRHAFDLELVRLFASGRRGATAAEAVLAAATAGVLSLWVPPLAVAAWLGGTLLAVLVVAVSARLFLRQPQGHAHGAAQGHTRVRAWTRGFVLAEALGGMAWGSCVFLVLGAHDPAAQTFVLFVLLLVGALTAMISAPVPAAVYAGLIPMTAGIALYARPAVGYQYLPVLAVAGVAQLSFVLLARRLYATTLATLSFQAEKDALIVELEQAKLNSDEARRRAEEASLAKSRFLATMSHELRTPLNAILGFSEVMKGELFGQHSVPVYRDYSADIHSSGQHLLMLINEILDLSRVEAGRYELKEEPTSLALIAEDCQHLLMLRASKREITVTEMIEPSLPPIWADERAMRQVVLNLLSNAIKFTPQGGTVTIKVGWTAQGGQYFAIRDTGPGIPEAEIPIVMSSFGRGTLAQKNAEEGSGLGLPIVKGLVELHDGSFTIKSRVREGTEVIVILPPERVIDALPALDPDAPAEQRPARPTRRAQRPAA
ncbi:sensor histidine kinase [Lichenibacterium dinghuense]|uniref:sensor histidine kinase n=1 Tax=Lichenibacterium dinghuense TaxID=2895977 RepID=UPI001F230C08|nr:HAMP domain-containing sensor histidine kinase [Lichenibacterium sp. 6Y81]